MDPNATYSSLQKTLPDIDPAVFYHFTTEVSAQASLLATQQQQLKHLTSLTEELVRYMPALRLPAPGKERSLKESTSVCFCRNFHHYQPPSGISGKKLWITYAGISASILHVYRSAAAVISHGQ